MSVQKSAMAVLFALLLAGCSDNDNSSINATCQQIVSQQGCGIVQQNQCVHAIMQEDYYWYREVPQTVNYSDFSSPDEILDFLRYQDPGPDRFSYLTAQSSFQNLFNAGQQVGFGFSSIIDADGRVWVRFVYDDSAAGRAGMERGDEIVSVDGVLLTSITGTPDWRQIFGPSEAGYELDMVLNKPLTGTTPISMVKSTYNINTVLHHSVIDDSGTKTGYLVFSSFLSTSLAELDQVFAEFASENVTRVILDLRYNGGGSVAVANYLASYLYQGPSGNEVFGRLEFNDRNQDSNTNFTFVDDLPHQLTPDKLIIITTGETASASEMIINGLTPFLDVRTVGSQTFGKPVGQNPFYFCDRALLPITFKTVNSDGEGEYFNGFPAECDASDDVTVDFGNLNDPMLAEALYLARNNACQSSSARAVSLPVYQPLTRQGLDAINPAH